MKKRMLTLLLVLAMVFSVCIPVLAENGNDPSVPLYSVEDFFFLPETTGFYLTADGQSLLYLAQADGILNIFRKDIASGKETQLTFEKDQHILNYFLKGDTLLYVRDNQGDEVTQVYRVNDDGTTINLTPYPGVLVIPVSLLEETNADDEILVAMNMENPQLMNIYRLNIRTGELIQVLEQAMDGLIMDNDGTIRMINVIDGLKMTLYHRYKDEDEFVLVGSWDIDECPSPVFFDEKNENVYAVSNIGRNTTALVLMEPATGKELKAISSRNDVDVFGLSLSEPGIPGIVSYFTDKLELVFLDKKMESWYKAVASLFDDDCIISITSTSDDMNMILVSAYSDVDLGGIYLVNLKDRNVEQLVDRNGKIDPKHMAPMSFIDYKARDGLTIPGYLTLPVGVEPENLPVVVIPHGGPWMRDYWGFNPEAQFLANRGYAVFQPNFRGSAGYGRKHLEAGFGEWGLAMQDDISDGVQWLIEQGIADPDRVGIYGGSYGGYAALAGAAFTPELYAAVISYVGVSNLFTFIDSIPAWWESQREMLYHRVGHPERDFDRFMATSPVFHAGNIRAPLFLAHGANDPRVALDESLQIVAAMSAHDIDVELYIAWDEGHGFLNDANREIFYRVMEVFFAEHLGGRTLTQREDLPDPLFDMSPLDNWGKTRFSDVMISDWFFEAVEFAYHTGLMQGTSTDKFSPNSAATRGMIATILYRMAGRPDASEYPNPFDDVPEGAWYFDAVKWAVEEGVSDDAGDGMFAPNAPITRQDLALFISNFSENIGLELPEFQEYTGFDDEDEISDYAKDAVMLLFEAMIINGKPGNVFDPLGSATRAELATMLMRFVGVLSAVS